MAPAAGDDGTLERITLRDGKALALRPIGREDRDVLAEAFERLSLESRYHRFLAAKLRLSDSELTYLTDVDHHDHEALVAIDPETGDGVGVGRYVRLDPGGDVAEPAVTVADEWQGRGLGTALLEALCERARTSGIRRFRALLLVDNEAMIEVFERVGDVRIVERDGQTITLETDLAPSSGVSAALLEALRAAARGGLVCRRALWPAHGK